MVPLILGPRFLKPDLRKEVGMDLWVWVTSSSAVSGEYGRGGEICC